MMAIIRMIRDFIWPRHERVNRILVDREGIAYLPVREVVLRAKQ